MFALVLNFMSAGLEVVESLPTAYPVSKLVICYSVA